MFTYSNQFQGLVSPVDRGHPNKTSNRICVSLLFFGLGSICGLGGKFHFRIQPIRSFQFCFCFSFTELLTFTVNRLLNDVTEAGEILGVRLERNVQRPKIQNLLKPVFHLYLMFLFRQLDEHDAPMMKMTDKDT